LKWRIWCSNGNGMFDNSIGAAVVDSREYDGVVLKKDKP
jgi:hypothetical protein